MNIDLCTLDWVAISAIATAIMVIITGITLWQNRKQLNELKKQYIPKLYPVIVRHNNKFYLKIINVSSIFIIDIVIRVSSNGKKLLYVKALNNIEKVKFVIEPNGYKLFHISDKVIYLTDGKNDTEFDVLEVTLQYSNIKETYFIDGAEVEYISEIDDQEIVSRLNDISDKIGRIRILRGEKS